MKKGMLLATLSCIVFLSSSNAQWEQIKAGGPYWGLVNCLALLPVSGGEMNILFAGTDNGGVYVTMDDGASWSQANNGLPVGAITAFLVRNINGTPIIFAGTRTSRDTIYFSTNKGVEWIGMSNGITGQGVGAFGVMGNDMFVALSTLLFKSSDDGAHWTQCAEGAKITSIASNDTHLYYGTNGGGVSLSTDRGTTWSVVNKGLPDPTQRQRIQINCLTTIGSKVYAGSISRGVFLTINDGAQWDARPTEDGHCLESSNVHAFASVSTTIIAGTSCGVSYTDNDGTPWYPLNTGFSDVSVNCFASDGFTLYAGMADGSVWKRSLIPTVPRLVYPADSAKGIHIGEALVWDKHELATTFQLQLTYEPDFNTIVLDTTAGIEGYGRYPEIVIRSLAKQTKYYWRGRLFFGTNQSPWSKVSSFTTEYRALSEPALVVPLDGATEIGTDTTFTWSPVNGATQYHLELTMPPQIVLDTTVLSTSVTVWNLRPGSSFAWRVQALNANVTGPWTKSRVFSTKASQPQAPYLKNPANGAISILRDTTLSWYPAAGYSYYRLQLANNAAMSPTVLDVDSINSESYLVHSLKQSASYFWRVQASGSGGSSGWSSIWSFQTLWVPTETQPLASSVFSLSACYPNPVSNSGERATISYHLETASAVRITLCDILGRERKLLLDATSEAGEHSLSFQPSGLPAGMYFIRMQACESVRTRALVIRN